MSHAIKRFLGVLAFLGFAVGNGMAQNIPYSITDWKSPGDGLIVQFDGPLSPNPGDVTRLDWLNTGLTLGQSFNYVLGQTSFDGQFAGFRFATVYEIDTLMRGPLGYQGWMVQSGESPANILKFAALVGIKYQGPPGCCFTGALYDYPMQEIAHTAGMLFYGDFAGSSVNQAVFDKDSAFPQLGSFLVREHVMAVPEPATWILFMSGLVATWLGNSRGLSLMTFRRGIIIRLRSVTSRRPIDKEE